MILIGAEGQVSLPDPGSIAYPVKKFQFINSNQEKHIFIALTSLTILIIPNSKCNTVYDPSKLKRFQDFHSMNCYWLGFNYITTSQQCLIS